MVVPQFMKKTGISAKDIENNRLVDQANTGRRMTSFDIGLDGFDARLTQAITHTGLNQSEFARQLGVSAGFVSDCVRGQKKPGAPFLYAVRLIW